MIDQTIQEFRENVNQVALNVAPGAIVSAADFAGAFGDAAGADLAGATAQAIERQGDKITMIFADAHSRNLSGLHAKFERKVSFNVVQCGPVLELKHIHGIEVSKTGLLLNPLDTMKLTTDAKGNTVIDAGLKLFGLMGKHVRIVVDPSGKQI